VDQFLAALDRLPIGYSEGRYAGHRWGVTLDMAADRRRCWLWGEQLGGAGRVSFNLYRLADGPVLRPCEMPAETVIAFVLAYRPDPDLITPPRPASVDPVRRRGRLLICALPIVRAALAGSFALPG
jgi:hypothetical protein